GCGSGWRACPARCVALTIKTGGYPAMKVALTGATGFIGSHVLTELHEHGHEVTALVQFGQYVRSDEPGRTGECHFHRRIASCLDRQGNASGGTSSPAGPAPGLALLSGPG